MRTKLVLLVCVLFLCVPMAAWANEFAWNESGAKRIKVYDFTWITGADGYRAAIWPAGDGVWVQFSAYFTGMDQGRLAPHKVGMTGFWVFPREPLEPLCVWGTLAEVQFEYPYPEDPERLEITSHIITNPV